MKLIVIEVTRAGKVGYLKSTSIFCQDNIVDHPMQAINYAAEENVGDLESDLHDLRLAGDEIYAKSGVAVDTADVVEFEVSVQETSRRPGRAPHKSRLPQ